MNGKHYIGKRVSHIEKYDETAPISGVALLLDENNEILAGDQNGFVLDITCPYGTQEMANDILAKLQGHTYKGFRADNAPLDIGAELGDGVTVDGLYSVLAYRSVRFGPGHFSEIAAPGENELRHEYNYLSPTEKLQRKIASTNSRITKTAEQIKLEVNNEIKGLSSSLELTANSLTSQIQAIDGRVTTVKQTVDGLTVDVNGPNGKFSKLQQKVDSFTISVDNGSTSSTIKLTAGGAEIVSQEIKMTGLVTFTGLSNGTTEINGACIKTGTIDAKRLNLSGAISFSDLSDYNNINSEIEDAAAAANAAQGSADSANSGINKIVSGMYTGKSGTFINGRNIFTPNIHTNNLHIYATDEGDGGLYLNAKVNGAPKVMLAIKYYQPEYAPYVEIGSPADATIRFSGKIDFSGATVTGI